MDKENKKFLNYYRQYKDKIFNYFYYRLNFNRCQAEDLCSEVFIKAFSSFDSFDDSRSFQAWIYTIARNHLINFYRTINREVKINEAEGYEPGKEVELSLECERIIKFIMKLEPYYQEVLLLRYVDELDNQEIALVLEKDEGAVRTQISRALKELKEQLAAFE